MTGRPPVVHRPLTSLGLLAAVGLIAFAWAMQITIAPVEWLDDPLDELGVDYQTVSTALPPVTEAFLRQMLGDAAVPARADDVTQAPGGSVTSASGTAPAPADATARGDEAAIGPAPTERGRHSPTNDNRAASIAVTSVPYTATSDASGATREPGEAAACAPVGGTVWYHLDADTDLALIAATFTPGTQVAVLSGPDPASSRVVACGTAGVAGSTTRFVAREGTRYHFQVTGHAAARDLTFTVVAAGRTDLVSHDPDRPVTKFTGAISPDGRYVVAALNPEPLTPGPSPVFGRGLQNILTIHDRVEGTASILPLGHNGEVPNGPMGQTAVSADGNVIAFWSEAENLDVQPRDDNGWADAFVYDRRTSTLERITLTTTGEQAPPPEDPFTTHVHDREVRAVESGWDRMIDISDDGTTVVFGTMMRLDPRHQGGTPFWTRVYVHERGVGTTLLTGQLPDRVSEIDEWFPSLSADGRYVTYRLNRGLRGHLQIHLHDRFTGVDQVVSVNPAGAPGNDIAYKSAVTDDGRFVAFTSLASDLDRASPDTNGMPDVFVRDMVEGVTTRVSVASDGSEAVAGDDVHPRTGGSQPFVWISGDGRFVGFDSTAPNLDPTDRRVNEPTPSDPDNDVFIHDRVHRTTTMVSVSSTGEQANERSWMAGMDASGSAVLMVTLADNLGGAESETPTMALGRYGLYVHQLPTDRRFHE